MRRRLLPVIRDWKCDGKWFFLNLCDTRDHCGLLTLGKTQEDFAQAMSDMPNRPVVSEDGLPHSLVISLESNRRCR
jgi:hypothetical protein